MSNRKWTQDYVQQRFPAEVREVRRKEGESTDVKPTHEWLREHGYSGIQGYAERHDKTVDEVLLEECGFDRRKKKPLPGTHAETKKLIRKWLQDEEEFSRLNDTSVNNAWTHMRRLMALSREALESSNLLRPARAPSRKNTRLILSLFRAMNDEFESEGTRYNYASTLSKFYDYLKIIGEADSNPVEDVLPRMGWTYTRESPENTLTPEQVRECWRATRSIDEEAREELSSEILREQLVEKMLLLSLAGCGARTSDLLVINAQEDIILDPEDPRICFGEERKNGLGTVPIMAGRDYFKQYIELLEEEGYEMLFPSEQSADGTRSDTWVRDKVEEIVERAEVRLPDESKPTPKHFRQFWFNEYLEAYEAYIARVNDIATEQSSDSPDITEKHYLTSDHERDQFRQYARAHFEAAFPADVAISPKEIKEARSDVDDGQSSLGDFAGAWLPGAATVCASAQAIKARMIREKVAIEHDPRTSLPSRQETAILTVSVLTLSTLLGIITAAHGINPLVDIRSVPPEMPLAFVLGIAYIIYDMPDLEEPPA